MSNPGEFQQLFRAPHQGIHCTSNNPELLTRYKLGVDFNMPNMIQCILILWAVNQNTYKAF